MLPLIILDVRIKPMGSIRAQQLKQPWGVTDGLFVAGYTYDVPLFNVSCNFNPEHILNII